MMGHVSALRCDLLVVGGGINGAGIARDAAGRGLSVVLCEQDDLAAHTSSASSKLIHGGLRYLQYGELGLVRKALREREVLMRSAPHLIRPLRFVLPQLPGLRPAWMLRCGLFLYDHLARRELLPGSSHINLRTHAAGLPLANGIDSGFVYSDAAVDDARLVVLNALDAHERGAIILPRTRCVSMYASDNLWHATLRSEDGRATMVEARCVVNASGAWALDLLKQAQVPSQRQLRMVKGSHIVVPRLFQHDEAYLFQNDDGRIVFALPFEQHYTLIGTTDVEFTEDPRRVSISAEETTYLCNISNRYFRKQISPADVVWSYAGIRPLLDDGAGNAQAVTRDYELHTDTAAAPLLSVFGGKVTTYRKLAEEALDRIAQLIDVPGVAWTSAACLPGGGILGAAPANASVLQFGDFIQRLQRQYPWLPAPLTQRYARAYGTRVHKLLTGCHSLADLGVALAPGLHEGELHYLMDNEWARSAHDVLWRRSKLGLQAPASAARLIDAWMQRHLRQTPVSAAGGRHA
ncbi:glycerol-3-phosphate dehydrogenase [Duganella sp. CY15W]|uniref:glycerol-3-phosphate dehydrogenase n=1 Tax=Duganella sp. CY15W TaxID=2692172 RepID=UPI001E578D34|nr:glycerol-3-phosphate dehydrogenase [Duganella sp. CY15W]